MESPVIPCWRRAAGATVRTIGRLQPVESVAQFAVADEEADVRRAPADTRLSVTVDKLFHSSGQSVGEEKHCRERILTVALSQPGKTTGTVSPTFWFVYSVQNMASTGMLGSSEQRPMWPAL